MIVFAVLAAALLVTAIHESGHLVAARWAGATVSAVRVGYGPRLGAFRAAGTAYEISLLPLGGRVHYQRLGSDGANAVIASAGPLANFAFAAALLVVTAATVGVETMPHGGGTGGPFGYAAATIAWWTGLVYRIVVGWLGGSQRASFDAIADLADALRAPAVAPKAYFLAVLSTLWGVLNLIPLPVIGTDGWHIVAAGARAVHRLLSGGE